MYTACRISCVSLSVDVESPSVVQSLGVAVVAQAITVPLIVADSGQDICSVLELWTKSRLCYSF